MSSWVPDLCSFDSSSCLRTGSSEDYLPHFRDGYAACPPGYFTSLLLICALLHRHLLLSVSSLYLCLEVTRAVSLAGHVLSSFSTPLGGWVVGEEYQVSQSGTLEISHMVPVCLMLEMTTLVLGVARTVARCRMCEQDSLCSL